MHLVHHITSFRCHCEGKRHSMLTSLLWLPWDGVLGSIYWVLWCLFSGSQCFISGECAYSGSQFWYKLLMLSRYFVSIRQAEQLQTQYGKNTVVCDLTPCSLVEGHWRNVLPPFSGLKSQARKKQEKAEIFLLWRWRQCLPLKHRCTSIGLRSVTTQMIVLVIVITLENLKFNTI
jgi:hypothetical protein